jgi:hypothetical protein
MTKKTNRLLIKITKMKIVLKIIGTLVVIISLLIGSISVKRNFDDATKKGVTSEEITAFTSQVDSLKKINESLTGASKEAMTVELEKAEKELNNLATSSTYKMAGYLLLVLCVLSLVSGFLLYQPKPKAFKIVLGLVVIVAAMAIVLSPNPERGMTSGLPNRTIAIITGAFSLASILIAFASHQKNKTS